MGDRQVFSETSGRRARWVIVFEIALGWGAVVVAAFIMFALVTAR